MDQSPTLPIADAIAETMPVGVTRLTPEHFAKSFEAARRTLWIVAAAVVSDRAEADDLVQEAAIVGLARLEDFAPGSSFVAWMSQIVRNLARNSSRKTKRRRTSSVEMTTLDRNPAPASATLGINPLNARGDIGRDELFDQSVLNAVRALDEAPRICLLLKTVAELPYADISRIMDIPEGTAMSHVHRAKRFLRERLADRAGGIS